MKIYLDNNATTPVDSQVIEAMLPYFDVRFGNPSSGHRFGETARLGVERARGQIGALMNCHPDRLIFTSGGSEANNLAIFSAVHAAPGKKHIIASAVEHASVLEPLRYLEKQHGYTVELLPVDEKGGLSLENLALAIKSDTVLVSLMAANNETGVIWPLEKISAICMEKNVYYHCDAVQLIGKAALDLAALPIDYLAVSGHKLHGPKGVGVLYAKRTAPLSPIIHGAGQEKGNRAGTENVPGIVGLGMACELAGEHLGIFEKEVSVLRDLLENEIKTRIEDVMINGAGMPRLINTSNISFQYCSSAALIQELDEKGIAVSAHSACQSGDLDPSHVLAAMEIPETYLHGTLRISLSRMNSRADVDALLEILPAIVAKLRKGFAL
ncbi:MAG: aminotransferase class V-fold PLP-dependent enzyme [Proteobacteria bacterium]|nr:aminotransferase class V-fold PLP-dependent enzyme [Pseudomonadota bacterium]